MQASSTRASPVAPDAAGPTPPASGTPHERLVGLGLRPVEPASAGADALQGLMAVTPLFSGLDAAELDRLGAFMVVYDAPAGVTVIAEGEVGDFMMLLTQGAIEVVRGGQPGRGSRISVARAGQALGEMSMFDGEPRFASCVTLEPSRIAVLGRDAMMQVMQDEPRLGGRIMLRLVQLLSERLRETSARLVTYIEAAREA